MSLANKQFGITNALNMHPNITKRRKTHQRSKKQQSDYLGTGKHSNFTEKNNLLQKTVLFNSLNKLFLKNKYAGLPLPLSNNQEITKWV